MKAYWFNNVKNVGDMLSPVTIKGVTGVTPEWSDVTPEITPRVVGLGSIMNAVRPGDMVWGTGCMTERYYDMTGMHVLAVRGPLTAKCLGVDVPFGDPALLMPRFYKPSTYLPRHEVGIVPHYVDYAQVKDRKDDIPVIDVRMAWQKTIDYITSCDVIVSSSLHGIIIAEAYGIPAVWVRISGRVIGGSFKFDDYYLSTGRKPVEPARLSHLWDAVDRVQPPPVFDPAPLLEVAKRLPRV